MSAVVPNSEMIQSLSARATVSQCFKSHAFELFRSRAKRTELVNSRTRRR
jgi:hypothetical protein